MSIQKAVFIAVLINLYVFSLVTVPFYWNRFTPESQCVLLDILDPNYLRILGAGNMFLIVTICIVFYCLIGRTAIEQKKKVASISVVSSQEEKKQNLTIMENIKMHKKAAKNLLMVTIVFAACVLPFAVTIVLYVKDEVTPRSSFGNFMEVISLTLLFLNSGINPVIYGLKFPKFRQAFKVILSCKRYSMHTTFE